MCEMRPGVCVRIVVVKGLNFIDFEFEKLNSLTKSICFFHCESNQMV